jgi:hypothetical protein
MNQNQTLIFLDIDGVMNCHQCLLFSARQLVESLDPCGHRACLKEIVRQHNGTVVLSSTWRRTTDHRRAVWQVLKDLNIPIEGVTPILDTGQRGDDVLSWLFQRDLHGAKFLCIDDNEDFDGIEDHLLLTTMSHGLQQHHIDEAREILREQG